jgi:hypothetical protein
LRLIVTVTGLRFRLARSGTFLTMVVCAWVVSAPRVEASGCHAPSRPVFGVELIDDADAVTPVTTDGSAGPILGSRPLLDRLPCSGEVPGPMASRVEPVPPAVIGPGGRMGGGKKATGRVDRESYAPVPPRPVPDRPSRPPRGD